MGISETLLATKYAKSPLAAHASQIDLACSYKLKHVYFGQRKVLEVGSLQVLSSSSLAHTSVVEGRVTFGPILFV